MFDHGYKGCPADVWSAGICLFAILYGHVPIKASHMDDLTQPMYDAVSDLKETISESARNLLDTMLQKDPSHRLNASQILQHEWLADVDMTTDILDEQERHLIRKEFTYQLQHKKLKAGRDVTDLNT